MRVHIPLRSLSVLLFLALMAPGAEAKPKKGGTTNSAPSVTVPFVEDVAIKRRPVIAPFDPRQGQSLTRAAPEQKAELTAGVCRDWPRLLPASACGAPGNANIRAMSLDDAMDLAGLFVREADVQSDVRRATKDAAPVPLTLAIGVYKGVLNQKPSVVQEARALYGLATCLSYGVMSANEAPRAEGTDLVGAAQMYARVVERAPESELATYARMWLAEHFLFRETNDKGAPATAAEVKRHLATAIEHLKALSTKGPFAEQASIHLMAAYHLDQQVDAALNTADAVLAGLPNSGRREEVFELLAAVYAAKATLGQGADLATVARAHLERASGQAWAPEATLAVAVHLAVDGEWGASDALWEMFLERFPTHPDATLARFNRYQLAHAEEYLVARQHDGSVRTVTIPPSPTGRDANASMDAYRALARDAQEGSAWAKVNESKPEVIRRARELVEGLSGDVYATSAAGAAMAYNAWVAAPGPSTEAERKAAAGAFVATATDVFAAAPRLATERARFEVARARLWAGDTAAALRELDAIVDARSDTCLADEDARTPTCAESALQLGWRTRREALVTQAGGDLATSPGYTLVGDASPRPTLKGTPAVESTVTTKAGRAIARYAMSPAHADYLRSTDAFLAATISDPTIRGWRDDARGGLELQSAQILYAHGQLPEARARAHALIARAPAGDTATAAANLVLMSLRDEGDDAGVAVAAADFATKVRGAGASDYAAVGLVAEFRTIETLDPVYGPKVNRTADDATLASIAQRYLAFAGAHAETDAGRVAKGRSIDLLARAGHAGEARTTAAAYAAAHANAPEALLAHWYVATQSMRMLDLPAARAAFEAVLTTHARLGKADDDEDALADLEAQGISATHARWFLAALAEAEGDPRAAAEAWLAYAREVAPRTVAEANGAPTDEQAYWHAATFWAQVGPREHARALKNYLARDFAEPDPDHVVQAYLAQAKLAEANGDARGATRAQTSAREAYDAALKKGEAFTLETHGALAAGDIVALEAAFNAPGPGRPWPTDKKALLTDLIAVLDGGDVAPVLERATPMLGNPASQQAAGTIIGQAWLRHAALLDIVDPGEGNGDTTAFPVTTLGEAFEPGMDGFDLWTRLLVDEDPEAFKALPNLKRSPEQVISANEARDRATDILERVVDHAAANHTWGPWTERAVSLLATQTRGVEEQWHTPYCGAGPCAAEAVPAPIAPATLPALDGSPTNAALAEHAMAAVKDGNLHRARLVAAQLRGDGADLHLTQASIAAAAGELEGANAAFDRALARDGANLEALRGRTVGAFRAHDDATALLLARKWVEAAPQDADALLHLGAALLTESANARRHHDGTQADTLATEAVEVLDRAVKVKTSLDALRELAVARVQLADAPDTATKAKQAIDAFLAAAAASPTPLQPDEVKRWNRLTRRMEMAQRRGLTSAPAVAVPEVAPTEAGTCGVEVAKRRTGEVKRCVQAALKANPALAGELTLVWNITSGVVEDVRVTANTTGSETLGACAEAAVQTWTFPADVTCTSPPYTWRVVAK